MRGTDENAIGTGPYVRTAWDQAAKIVFQRNPDYWNEDTAYLDEVQFLIIPDANSAKAAFQTNQIDILETRSCIDADDVVAQVPDAQRQPLRTVSPEIAFDTTKPPFNDVRVRRAMALLYDREAEAEAIFCGSSVNTGALPSEQALTPEDIPEALKYLTRDVQGAKDLLAAAGYSDGFVTRAAWTPQYGPIESGTLERYIGDARELGIEITPDSYEYGVWINDVYRGAFEFEGICWGPPKFYSDPDGYLYRWLHPDGIENRSTSNDPAMTELLEKQRTQLELEERWETIHDIQRLDAELMYYVWRNIGSNGVFSRPRVRDYHYHAAYDYQEFRHISLADA